MARPVATIVSESKRLRSGSMARRVRLGSVLGLLAASACTASNPTGANSQTPSQSSASLQAQVAFDIAAREQAAGDTAEAIAYYNSVVTLHSKLKVRAYVGLGDTLLDAGVINEAADDYRQALRLSPENPQALIGIGATLVALDQPVAAESELRKGLELSPSARGLRALTIVEDLLGKYQVAVSDSEGGLSQFPDDRGLREDLGLSQALAGDFEDAVATMQAAASASDAAARDRLNLALVLGLAGRDAEAAEAAQGDLDATSIQSNLLYYAELRALPASARAAALLRPGAAASARPETESAPAVTPAAPVAAAPAMAPTVPVAAVALPSIEQAPTGASAQSAGAQPPVSVQSGVPPRWERRNPIAAASELLPAVAAAVAETGSGRAATSVRTFGLLGPTAPKPGKSPVLAANYEPQAADVPAAETVSGNTSGNEGPEAQLGALPSKDDAMREWRLLQAKMPSVLSGRDPSITEVVMPSVGTVYRLRVGGFATVVEALKFCSDVGAAGGACAVF